MLDNIVRFRPTLIGFLFLLVLLIFQETTIAKAGCVNLVFVSSQTTHQPSDMAKTCQEKLAETPNNFRDVFRVFQMRLIAEDIDGASRLLSQMKAESGEGKIARIALGTAYLKANKIDEAIQIYQTIDGQTILGSSALEAYAAESYAEALLFGEAARALWQENGLQSPFQKDMARHILSMLGQIYANKQPAPLKAAAVYAELTTIVPGNMDSYLNAGNKYLIGGDKEKALFWTTKAQELFPNAWEPAYRLGIIHLSQQQVDIAVEKLQRAVELDQKQTQSWFQLGKALQLQGNSTAAVEAFEQAFALSPDNIEIEKALDQAKDRRND